MRGGRGLQMVSGTKEICGEMAMRKEGGGEVRMGRLSIRLEDRITWAWARELNRSN